MNKPLHFIIAMACCASLADAATVTFTLDLERLGAGNFELRATTSAGDNGGLAAYNVSLTNVATVNHNSLRNGAAQNGDGSQEGPVGFTLLRTADDTSAATVGPTSIHGSQDTITPTPFVIYGMGQTSGDLSSRGITTVGSKEGDPWAADMVIATGTYTSGLFPAFDLQSSVPTFANVFHVAGAAATSAAVVERLVIGIDGQQSVIEPGSLGGGAAPIPTPPQSGGPPSVPTPPPPFDPFARAPQSQAGVPVSVELTRRTRPVSAKELAAGAPDGYVHEFFITSATDVIGIRDVSIDVPVFQSKHSLDYRPPNAKELVLFAGASADSFADTPGSTNVLGDYARGLEDPETIWYSLARTGAQDEFLFARLTVGEAGSFVGTIGVAGPSGTVYVPFDFLLPGTADDLALLDAETPFLFTLHPASSEPTAVGQIPEPTAWMLLVIGLSLLARRAYAR